MLDAKLGGEFAVPVFVQLQAPGYEADFGVGLIDNSVQLGGVLRTDFHGLKLMTPLTAE